MTFKRSPRLFFWAAFWVGLIPFTFSAAFAAEEKLTLADGGATDYVIVLPEKPSAVQESAGKELAATLKEISGAEFPIQNETADSADPNRKQLVIGPSKASKRLLGDSVDESTLAYDAIVIKRVGNSIVFSGHPQRGTLYAVETFLEDALGCRWWTATESFIPKSNRVEATDFDAVYAPKLINRESFYQGVIGAGHGEFAVRLKCNGNSNDIPDELGGHQRYLHFVHSFYPLIPPQRYFEEHPDWFPEIDGVRKVGVPDWCHPSQDYKDFAARLKPEQLYPNGTQLCLSSEGLFDEMLKNVLDGLEKNPKATIVSISQNDWHGYCQCEKCRQIAEEEESQAGPLVRFVNRMGEEIEKVRPDVFVDTLAYQYSRKPPKITRARNNVIIRLCSIECSFIQTLDGRYGKPLSEAAAGQTGDNLRRPIVEDQNAKFRSDMEGWSRMADHLFVWDYMTDFALYLLPFPNYRVWADNIRFFIDHHTIGLFEQGDYQAATGDFVQLRAWVVAKLLWNPDLDQRELMKEFIQGYYAPELVPVYFAYFDLLADRFEKTGDHLGIFRRTAFDWFDLETLNQATEIQETAQAIAAELEKANPDRYAGLVYKVRREQIPLDLVRLMNYPDYVLIAKVTGKPLLGPKANEMKGLAEDFAARLDAAGVRQQAEWASPENFANFKQSFIDRYSFPVTDAPVPEVCRDLPLDRWVDLQEGNLQLLQPEEWTFVEEDAAASDGVTVRMPTNHQEWGVSASFDLLGTSLTEKFGTIDAIPTCRLYAYARCDAADADASLPAGDALKVGIYDEANQKEILVRSVPIADLAGSGYKRIDLGEFKPSFGLKFWAAPIERTDLKDVFIDRFVITW